MTSLAGVHLKLNKYRREAVDGLWLSEAQVRTVSRTLLNMTYEDRMGEPCVGSERADLVVCGCAILEALMNKWPVARVRVADRGLREGILADLRQKNKARRKRRRSRYRR